MSEMSHRRSVVTLAPRLENDYICSRKTINIIIMDWGFLAQMTKGEERTLLKAFVIIAPLLYSTLWLYVPLFNTADVILQCSLLASADITILYFERGFLGFRSKLNGVELIIPLSVYVGFPIAATVVLLLAPWNFGTGLFFPLTHYAAAVLLCAFFFSKAVRLASVHLVTNPTDKGKTADNKRPQKQRPEDVKK